MVSNISNRNSQWLRKWSIDCVISLASLHWFDSFPSQERGTVTLDEGRWKYGSVRKSVEAGKAQHHSTHLAYLGSWVWSPKWKTSEKRKQHALLQGRVENNLEWSRKLMGMDSRSTLGILTEEHKILPLAKTSSSKNSVLSSRGESTGY